MFINDGNIILAKELFRAENTEPQLAGKTSVLNAVGIRVAAAQGLSRLHIVDVGWGKGSLHTVQGDPRRWCSHL